MKKLMFLYIVLSSLCILNGMEQEKAPYNAPGALSLSAPQELITNIICRTIECILNDCRTTQKKKLNKSCFKQFFTYLFSMHMRTYNLTPLHMKKYLTQFAYLAFILQKGNFVLPKCFTKKIKRVYFDTGKIFEYKYSLWALIASGQITDGRFLAGKDIRSLSCSIQFLIQLKNFSGDLSLAQNRLTTLPEEFGSLTKLTTLILTGNQLTVLPECLGKLTALTTLHVDNNKLHTVREEALPNQLQSLVLSNNCLSSLPKSLEKLTNLNVLGINYNNLDSLPEGFEKLIRLQILSLDNNHFTTLPPTFSRLSCLQIIDLSNNQLTDNLDVLLLTNLPQLNTIDLSNNQFSEQKKQEIKQLFGNKLKIINKKQELSVKSKEILL